MQRVRESEPRDVSRAATCRVWPTITETVNFKRRALRKLNEMCHTGFL